MTPLRRIAATRYITPLREGGSLPAIVEGEDDGLYVLKFRGAGQGVKALVAELMGGEVARAAGLPVPELVLMTLDGELARTEPDPEIQDLIRASATLVETSSGLNLALDYLPGSVTFDPVVDRPDAQLASRIVWFDAFIMNIDRTPRNANMLTWHRQLWLIDHGAALYVHHATDDFAGRAADAFPLIKDHVLLPLATGLQAADAAMRERLTPDVIDGIVNQVPDDWLGDDPAARRDTYRRFLTQRVAASSRFVEEAERARAQHL